MQLIGRTIQSNRPGASDNESKPIKTAQQLDHALTQTPAQSAICKVPIFV